MKAGASGDDASRRVVVTGLGVVSPLGNGRERFWEALKAGRSAFSRVRSFDPAGWRTEMGAEVDSPFPHSALGFALTAAAEALSDAGLVLRSSGLGAGGYDRSRAGAALGTTLGESVAVEGLMRSRLSGDEAAAQAGMSGLSPGNIAARLARELGLLGPVAVSTSACAAGNCSLAWAFDGIVEGDADLMLAGGTEVFTRRIFAGFNRLLAAAADVCAPFSKGRNGLVPAEGCAVLVLEEARAAASRGARVYAELLGYGASSDAFHATMPDPGGISRAIQACLDHAGLGPSEVGYVNAHGTGTPANDKAETEAIKKVFGDRAAEVPISSIKSMLGHAMGAASAMEAAASCLAIQTGILPPTMHFTGGDPDCGLDYVPNASRKTDPEVVLSNAFGFGGTNCVVAFGKPGRKRASEGDTPRRVVVTGLAVVGPEDAVALVERVLPGADMRFVDAPIAAALAAAKLALDHAGLDPSRVGDRAGVILDSSGEFETQYKFFEPLEKEGPAAVEPFLFPTMLANAAASRVAVQFKLRLVSRSFGGCFAAGENAVGDAFRFLRRHSPGIILAGGVRGDGPGKGAVENGGAGILVLEDRDSALGRGARIIAEMTSFNESFDPQPAPDPDSDCGALVQAIKGFIDSSNTDLEIDGRGAFGCRARLRFSRARSVGNSYKVW